MNEWVSVRIIFINFFLLVFLNWNTSLAKNCLQFLDKDNLPIAFAHVQIKSISDAKIIRELTNDNGKLCVEVELPIILQFSHIGFQPFSDTIYSIDENHIIKPKQSVVTLNDFVVTAQHNPVSSIDAVQRVRIITQQDIKDKAAVNLNELLNNQLNIRIQQDNVLGSGIEMMGMSGDKVKIMIDGIPVIGRLDGNIDLSQINLNNIERVEIIEGPLSVNYGNDALAGTINLITKKTFDKPVEGHFSLYHESVGQYNVEGGIGYKPKKLGFKLSGGRYYFDGFQGNASGRQLQWDPKEQYFANAELVTDRKGWGIKLQSYLFDELITNRGAIDTVYAEPGSGRQLQVGSDDYYSTFRWTNSLGVNKRIADKYQLNFQLAYNYYQRKKETRIKNLETLEEQRAEDNSAHDTTRFYLYTSRATIQSKVFQNKLSWELGYDLKLDQGSGPRIEGDIQSIGDYAGFASAQVKLSDKIETKAGVRVTENTAYDAPIVPSLDVKVDIAKRLKWRISYGRGFRAPNLKDLYFDFVDINHNIKGNPDLSAETSHSYSTSFSYQKPLKSTVVNSELKFYYNDVSDLIALAQTDTSAGLFQNVNINTHKTFGTQLDGQFRTPVWNVKAGIGYMAIYNIEFEDDSNFDEFFYSPELQFSVSRLIEKYQLRIAFFTKYTGARNNYSTDSEGEIVQVETGSFTMSDLTLSKPFLNKKLSVSTGIKNLFDVVNINSESNSTHSNSSTASISWGRSYFINLKYTL